MERPRFSFDALRSSPGNNTEPRRRIVYDIEINAWKQPDGTYLLSGNYKNEIHAKLTRPSIEDGWDCVFDLLVGMVERRTQNLFSKLCECPQQYADRVATSNDKTLILDEFSAQLEYGKVMRFRVFLKECTNN